MSKSADSQEPQRDYVSDPERLRSLQESGLLDSESDEGFDRYTRLAQRILGTRVSLISLVDSQQQYFKSHKGLSSPWCDIGGTPLDHSMCAMVVETSDVLVIEDARNDPYWCRHPAVMNIGVGSYLGYPIHDPQGHILGSFCVIDGEPRRWSEIDLESMFELTCMLESKIRLRWEIANRQQIALRLNETNLQLREYSAKVRNDLNTVAHEIRTSVAALKGHGEIAAVSEDQAERDTSVRAMRRNTDHLLSLVNDILEISRIESGTVKFESIVFEPALLAREIVVGLAPLVNGKGVKLSVELAGVNVPGNVSGDPTRIRQILMNLMTNSIKFTENGSVSLRMDFAHHGATEQPATGARGTLVWEVKDTGIGMSPAQISALFRPFSQSESSTFRRFGGSGLGLFISKELAEAMGGSIEVFSEVGQGSTFRVSVPVDLPPEATVADLKPRPAEVPERFTGKPRILVVEDTPDIQVIQRFLLTRAGCEPVIASDGLEAIRLVQDFQEGFDLILMDMHMPGMDGHDTARRIRELGYDGPMLAHSATVSADEIERMLEAGCDAYLEKPLDPKRFVGIVRPMIEKRPHPKRKGIA